MTRDCAQKWIRKIHRSLNDTGALLRCRINSGIADLHGRVQPCDDGCWNLEINPDSNEFLKTILHECIHWCDSRLPESTVLGIEQQIYERMTDRQKLNLLRKVVNLT